MRKIILWADCPTGAEGTLYLVIKRTIQTRVP